MLFCNSKFRSYDTSTILGIKDDFTFSTQNASAFYQDAVDTAYVGEIVSTGTEENLIVSTRPYDDSSGEIADSVFDSNNLIRDDTGKIVAFGYSIHIDPVDLEEEPEEYSSICELLRTECQELLDQYKVLSDFYKKLKRNQRRNAFI